MTQLRITMVIFCPCICTLNGFTNKLIPSS